MYFLPRKRQQVSALVLGICESHYSIRSSVQKFAELLYVEATLRLVL